MLQLTQIPDETRYALRALARNRGYTVIVVLSLALGLTLTAATASVFDAYLVRSMPYPDADRLYHVIYAPQGQPEPRGMTALDWSSASDVVEVADNSSGMRFYLTDGGYVQEAQGMQVAFRSMEALGVRAVLGRPLEQSDFSPGAEAVALIGQSLWRDRFGSDPNVLGQVFRATLNDQADPPQTFRIVGLLSEEFRDARNYGRNLIDIVTPLRAPARTYAVRLREGVTPSVAERRITEVARAVATSLPANWAGVKLESVQERYVRNLRPVLMAVLVAVGLVLVIVVANVTVLATLRAARRRGEWGVRVALGASRLQMFRLLVMENGLLCATAVAISLASTAGVLRLLAPAIEEQIGRPVPGGTAALAMDPAVLLGLMVAGVVMALFLPIIPVLTAGSPVLARPGKAATRARLALVAFEVAGSLALLVGCGLMVRSAVNLLQTDLGYETRQVLRSRIALPMRNFPNPEALELFYRQFLDRFSTGIDAQVALTSWPPFYEPTIQTVEAKDAGSNSWESGVMAVSADYFSLLGIPVRAGRVFTSNDRLGTEPVAIISETLAHRLWPEGNVVGRQIRTAEAPAAHSPLTVWRTVVGVVRDARQTYADADLKDVYIPFLQAPNQYAPLFIRTDRSPSQWMANLRTVVNDLGAGAMINDLRPLSVEGDRLTASTRFLTSILSVFAIFSGLLVIVGMYGVTAYSAQQREREVAIRIAVGATQNAIVRLFIKQGAAVLISGSVFGLAAASVLTRVLDSQLYGVGRFDMTTIVGMNLVLAVVVFLAIWRPATRAASKNPISALKQI